MISNIKKAATVSCGAFQLPNTSGEREARYGQIVFKYKFLYRKNSQYGAVPSIFSLLPRLAIKLPTEGVFYDLGSQKCQVASSSENFRIAALFSISQACVADGEKLH